MYVLQTVPQEVIEIKLLKKKVFIFILILSFNIKHMINV